MGRPHQGIRISRPDWIALILLQLGTSILFASRGWLTYKWDSPIRELIWEEKWWTPVLEKFDITWGHFARTSDSWITPTLEWTGVFLMISAILPWLPLLPRLQWTRWLLVPVILVLAIDAFARWVSKDMHAGTMMEYALRVFSPVALILIFRRDTIHSTNRRLTIIWLLLLATALTFTGHGLYAVGYYDVPLNFRTMTSEIIPASESTILLILEAAGWLDFLIVALVLIPRMPKIPMLGLGYLVVSTLTILLATFWSPLDMTGGMGFILGALVLIPFIPNARLMGLIYMTLWGGATTLARIWAYYDPNLPSNGLDPWFAEALVRTPHWLIPLWLIIWLKEKPNSRRKDF